MSQNVSAYLAQNIVSLRRVRKMTQQVLASTAGIPRSTLAYIESGSGNPSLKNLTAISEALQVGVETLLSRPRPDCKLIKAGEIPFEIRPGGTELFKLLPDNIPGMEIDRIEIQPGGKMGGLPHLVNTKEYLTCVAGEVDVQVSGDFYRVHVGDVFAFPGDRAHGYYNRSNELAICFSVVVRTLLVD